MFGELPSTSLTVLAQWLPHVGKRIVVHCTTYHLSRRDKFRGNDPALIRHELALNKCGASGRCLQTTMDYWLGSLKF
ncbi:MAG: hypothetical protein ACETWQ_01070 [Phycisphaerae bacterium]